MNKERKKMVWIYRRKNVGALKKTSEREDKRDAIKIKMKGGLRGRKNEHRLLVQVPTFKHEAEVLGLIYILKYKTNRFTFAQWEMRWMRYAQNVIWVEGYGEKILKDARGAEKKCGIKWTRGEERFSNKKLWMKHSNWHRNDGRKAQLRKK